jgi:hypothetical protein
MLASSFVVAAAFSATAAAAMKLEYHNLAKRAPTYITNSTGSESNYTYIGCYSDAVANRVLTHDITNAAPGGYANMTILNCANAANASGYLFFGAEYGGECWAGDKIAASSQIRSNSSCNMACRGNDTEWCGAGDFLQMYQLTSNITKIVYFEPPAPTTKTTPVPATTYVCPCSGPISLLTNIVPLPPRTMFQRRQLLPTSGPHSGATRI